MRIAKTADFALNELNILIVLCIRAVLPLFFFALEHFLIVNMA